MKKIMLALCCMLCTLHARPQSTPMALSAQTRTAVVTRLQQSLIDGYVHLDTARRMSDYIGGRLHQGAYDAITSPLEFAQVLTADLRQVYHDGHLSVSYDPRDNNPGTPPQHAPPPGNRGPNPEAREDNYGIKKTEILNGNIGYLRVDRFWEPTQEARATVVAAFKTLANSDAMIIDLRYNGGGFPPMVAFFCSFLLPPGTHINDMYTRKTGHTDSFYTTLADSSRAWENKPVVLLTSRRTFSGAEEMSYDLQTQHRVTIVGENTGGGAHPVRGVPLGNGFSGNIPFGRPVNPITHTDWEGTGIHPDIACAAKDALETAQLHIYETALARTTDENKRRKLTWARDFLNASLHPIPVPAATLQRYTGTYGERKVTLEHNTLFITALGGQLQQLIPLSDSTFKMADYDKVILTFSPDASQITSEYDDGFVTAVKRR